MTENLHYDKIGTIFDEYEKSKFKNSNRNSISLIF